MVDITKNPLYGYIRGILNKMSTAPLSEKRAWREIFRKIAVTLGTIEEIVLPPGEQNFLIEGTVTWLEGLTFYISDCKFYINGEYYEATGSTVTLSDADATNPRIDLFYADLDGTTGVAEGTAASEPLKPSIDLTERVEVSFALIPALATEPEGVSNTVIYDEDDDWTTSVSSASFVDTDATANPYAGTKHVRFSSAPAGEYIRFDRGSASTIDANLLVLKIWATSIARGRGQGLRLQFKNGNAYVGNPIFIQDGEYGFDATIRDAYQIVAIPTSDFSLVELFDILEITSTASGRGTISCDIDDVWLQAGVDAIDLSDFARLSVHNDFNKSQGSGISTLTDAATISWDMDENNVFEVTLDGNRTMAAPTNIIPGYTYILIVRQDGVTGSRTITWNSVFKWPYGTAPTLSTDPGAVDVISFVADSSGDLYGALGVADGQ